MGRLQWESSGELIRSEKTGSEEYKTFFWTQFVVEDLTEFLMFVSLQKPELLGTEPLDELMTLLIVLAGR